MLRLTLKNVVANRVRFALTTFAVVLGVSFVVSSFVLTDGLRSTFGNLSEEIVGGTDLELRPVDEFGAPTHLDPALIAEVDAVAGVEVAMPLIEGNDNAIRPLKADGTGISTAGPPQLAFGWISDAGLSSFTLVEGHAPTGAGEFAMDLDAAERHGFVLGEAYDVITPTELTRLELTGITRFGTNNDTVGATLMHLSPDSLLELTGEPGYDAIQIALAENADAEQVSADLRELGTSLAVVDNATLADEQRAEFSSGIDIIGNVMLGFAGVSLFVSVFIIYNTFSIVLSQRTRELALLRTVGADPAQLRRSVQAEAVVIGALASAIGIPAGMAMAFGLQALFGAIGADLPDIPAVVSARTVLVALVVGVGVTLIAAVGPARRASKVPAIAALRDDGGISGSEKGRGRLLGGAALLGSGALAGGWGLFAADSTSTIVTLLAIGAMGVFVGVTMLSPLLARPAVFAMGWPLRRIRGLSGRLATENAARNPRRTATTAAALMVGLALVSMALVVGESVKAQLRSTLDSSVKAEFLVTEETDDVGFPAALTNQVAALDAIDGAVGLSYSEVSSNGTITEAVGADLESAAQMFDLGIVEGAAFDPDARDSVLLSDEAATARALTVGDVTEVTFQSGTSVDLTVVGIFSDDVIFEEELLIDRAAWERAGADPTHYWAAVSTVDGASMEAAQAGFASLAASYPQVSVDTFNDYVDQLEGYVDQALTALNVMVALAVIIALIGIANTLALSVFERTRELGLLRAVGMTRAQLRRMVRLEAGLVALFGAGLGVTVGVAFGWAAVAALPSTITSTLAVPYTRILALVLVAAVAGLFAAWAPARRAGRLDVLEAISA